MWRLILQLIIVLLIGTSIPVIGLVSGKYVAVPGLIYGTYVHESVRSGLVVSRLFILIGTIGLTLGLLNPKLPIWFGEKTRARVLIIYSTIILIGVLCYFETKYLTTTISEREQTALSKLMDSLTEGMTESVLRSVAMQIDSNLELTGGDSSSYGRTPGFPYRYEPKYINRIKYPPLRTRDTIIVEMSDYPGKGTPVSERIVHIKRNGIVSMKPVLGPNEPRIYWGVFEINRGNITYTACGTETPLNVDLSGLQPISWIESFEDKGGGKKRLFAISSGVISTLENSNDDTGSIPVFKVLQGFKLGNEKAISCKTGL